MEKKRLTKKRWSRTLIMGSICCLFCLFLFTGMDKAEGTKVIQIYHTNDIHGVASEVFDDEKNLTNIGFAKMKSYIDEQKADGKLLMDAGDVFHGLSFATITEGDSMARLMQAMGYDVMTAGNHDFDYGTDRLLELKKKYDLPILAANVTKNKKELFEDSMILDADGVKVGVFGLATPETAYKTSPSNVEDVDFETPEEVMETARKEVKKLEGKADVIVALVHLGSESWAQPSSVQLAKKVPGIDIIIDGHSHSVLENYKVKDTYIASTGEFFNNLGEITITLEDNKIKKITTELVEAKELTKQEPDKKIAAKVEEINKEIEPLLKEVVTNSPVTLDGERENVRSKSTNLGRAVTRAMIEETGADIAIINGGSLRTSVEKGDVTKGQLISVMPFGNYVFTVSATGAEIKEALNKAMIVGTGSFPQFSGMTVKAKVVPEKLEDGTEYNRYEVTEIKVGNKALDEKKKYTVAINDYMYAGGDEYEAIVSDRTANEFGAMDEIFIRYMEKEDAVKLAGDDNLILSQK